jgi:hypothetical protein
LRGRNLRGLGDVVGALSDEVVVLVPEARGDAVHVLGEVHHEGAEGLCSVGLRERRERRAMVWGRGLGWKKGQDAEADSDAKARRARP